VSFDEKAALWDTDPVKNHRAQSVAEGIRAAVALKPEMSGFEYGCGTGLLSFALQPYLRHITLADNSTGMLKVLQEKIAAARIPNMTPLMLDLTVDAPPQEKFSLVYTLMTFHHIPDSAGMLRALYDLLEKGGSLCIADLDKEDGAFHGADFTGHNGFDRGALGRLAEEAGFRNVRFTTVFHMEKAVAGGKRTFPLFLMTAQKV